MPQDVQTEVPIDAEAKWFEPDAVDEVAEERDEPIDEYDLTSSPNDFNVTTLVDFIESGAVRIPGFQRNYIWDIRRASRLIESLVLGIPVPQLFWYEQARNKFLVIDGQQRLMSVYYFVKGRFPILEKRPELRRIFERNGMIPNEIFEDDHYFQKFNLNLPSGLPNHPNKFHGLNYSTLGDFTPQFRLRTIRNVIIKQIAPKGDDSVIYNIFYRLNWGGVNVTPQEIRISLYHSKFYDMLLRVNTMDGWRLFVGLEEPDLHVKDVEFLLRGFAMLIDGHNYNPSMSKFLNKFSKTAQSFGSDDVTYYEALFQSFVTACSGLSPNAFRISNKFSANVFEAVFSAACSGALSCRTLVGGKIRPESVEALRADNEFTRAAGSQSTNKPNVKVRLEKAQNLIVVG